MGTKSGILRYIGDFHLKEGTWGGVELDKPLGKNDGSVDSKRSLLLYLGLAFCFMFLFHPQIFRLSAHVWSICADRENQPSA